MSSSVAANSVDPDQIWQSVGLDMAQMCLALRWYFEGNYLEKAI